ncbi:MAG: copper resistance protein NlpE N-terminal domain-containing protein [Bacteroidaceae bacterium]|nr:copper resistance protein NlpE N-terminal domain-containing protein [Bacteroidaceae bacterium]
MKKIVLLMVAVSVLLLSACNSCNGEKPKAMIVETEIDSLYWVNDSTIADAQTFIFEGVSPMSNNNLADVILTIETINLNNDGTYTITTDYIDEGIATQNDNGDALIIMSSDNDSTMTVIELVSSNSYPTVSFIMQEDSSLVKMGSDGKPVTSNPAHKLNVKK